MVTYADIMSLLLCFFIALVSMSEIRDDRFRQAVDSLQKAFGGRDATFGAASLRPPALSPLVERLARLSSAVPEAAVRGSAGAEVQNPEFQVSSLPDGMQILVGGAFAFDPGSAELKPEARKSVAGAAAALADGQTRVVVRGHAGDEPLPVDGSLKDLRDLSYARAQAVARELEAGGVERGRIAAFAAGDTEPLKWHGHSDEDRATNRRVEIVVTEDLTVDDPGRLPVGDLKGPSDAE